MWYKRRDENISVARLIGEDKDEEIRQLSNEVLISSQFDVFIHQAVSQLLISMVRQMRMNLLVVIVTMMKNMLVSKTVMRKMLREMK